MQGGKNHASPRYIFTCLSPITRALFPKADDVLLDYLKEDGQPIEPSWYCPIIPLVLVNGSEGIGTGWSSFVPNYNPREIVANIRRLLAGQEMVPMHPWYKHFKVQLFSLAILCNAMKGTSVILFFDQKDAPEFQLIA
jgi:DNA topoisomerase-2